MRILITGGLGFVGSAVAVAALEAGHEVTILDDCSSGKVQVVERVLTITGALPRLVVGDVRDRAALNEAIADVNAVVHCAGLKSVVESATDPLSYFDVNVGGTVRLLQAMSAHDVHRIVFSSSATVYGTPELLPIPETAVVGVGLTNPYGRTKYIAELLLQDAAVADRSLRVTILRYFNPIGAHASGLLGEDPASTPTNVFPLIAEVARGARASLTVTGTDYPTHDGTGVRDYIHISDLADGHLAALSHDAEDTGGCRVYNLGTGRGTSVRELIDAYQHASGKQLAVTSGPRRLGDIAACFADPAAAARELSWRATRTVEDACVDSWAWQHHIGM